MTDSSQLIEIEKVFDLSPQLARLLQLLLSKDRVRKTDISDLISTFHSARPHHNADRMAIYRLRSRMRKHGVMVLVQYGEGYYLSAADKSVLRGRLRTPLPVS